MCRCDPSGKWMKIQLLILYDDVTSDWEVLRGYMQTIPIHSLLTLLIILLTLQYTQTVQMYMCYLVS